MTATEKTKSRAQRVVTLARTATRFEALAKKARDPKRARALRTQAARADLLAEKVLERTANLADQVMQLGKQMGAFHASPGNPGNTNVAFSDKGKAHAFSEKAKSMGWNFTEKEGPIPGTQLFLVKTGSVTKTAADANDIVKMALQRAESGASDLQKSLSLLAGREVDALGPITHRAKDHLDKALNALQIAVGDLRQLAQLAAKH